MIRSSAALRQDPYVPATSLDDCPIMPTQYFRHRSRSTLPGERRLLLAVLEEAVDSYCKSCGRSERRHQSQHEEAQAWLFSDDRSWFLSFANVCDVLDIEPESLRTRLAAWKAGRVKRKSAEASGRVFPLRIASR